MKNRVAWVLAAVLAVVGLIVGAPLNKTRAIAIAKLAMVIRSHQRVPPALWTVRREGTDWWVTARVITGYAADGRPWFTAQSTHFFTVNRYGLVVSYLKGY